MRRRQIGALIVLMVAAGVGGWLATPTPGRSLFADWNPTSKGKVWSIIAAPGSANLSFVDPTGAFQPFRDTYSIHYFLYDRDRGELCEPRKPTCTFSCGCIPTASVMMGSLAASYETFTSGGGCVSIARIRNEGNKPRRLSLFVVAVPYQLIGKQCGSVDIERDGRSLMVGGRALLSSDSAPAAGAAYVAKVDDATCDITGYVRNGGLPYTQHVHGKLSVITSGALRFDLALEPTQSRQIVLRSLGAVRQPVGVLRKRFVREWRSRLDRVGLELPDKRCEHCFRASVMYLNMLSASGKPVPGPTKYKLFWVRDCAYMADALYYAGQGDMIPSALEGLRSMQLPNGGFRARSTASDNELDAHGEAIYAFVQQYRRTRDKKWLASVWPSIASACRYVRAKRSGILPASVSAEDLGKEDQQHYWDDFWCVRGLRDASFAARELGKSADAAWMAAEAESLAKATRTSITSAMVRHSIGYIPNGPDEVASSAMARGTSCALWPCEAMDPADPLVRRSFDTYWRKWIAPDSGGFVHKGHFWPYAGMDLAQDYLILGQRDRAWKILDWTLDHDPARGLYSWPEGVFRGDLTLAEGDMPHGWMCAGYVSLVRNMLVRESGRDLVLLSGVPDSWLRPGMRIVVKDFPTQFGDVSYRAEMVGGSLRVATWGARPAGKIMIGTHGAQIPK